MDKFETIAADTDASRIMVMATELYGRDRSADVTSGRFTRFTATEGEMALMTAALDARGIEWGWA